MIYLIKENTHKTRKKIKEKRPMHRKVMCSFE